VTWIAKPYFKPMKASSQPVSRIVFILNIFLIVLMLLCCLVPFIPAGSCWPLALLGMGFPVLFLLAVLFFIYWFIRRSGRFLLPLLAMLLSWQQISVAFGLSAPERFIMQKKEGTLRVLSWNVSSWDDYSIRTSGGESSRNRMMELVREQDADILCLQEFLEAHDPKKIESNIPALRKMGYRYHYFFPTINIYNGYYKIGVVVFSKYPITDSSHTSFNQDASLESLLYADIKVREQTIRVMSTHLQSVHFSKSAYADLPGITKPAEGRMLATRIILSKLKNAYFYRSLQSAQVRQAVAESPYPVIVCGDLNDVPNSHTYFMVRGNLQDAFLKKGAGTGRTFRFLSPTLRIDYIFADKRFEVKQFKRIEVPYSDHYPIISDLRLQPGSSAGGL
jgi:endonuclease/exonuclease/phosphatase family metal-dependent hydrolase